MFWPKEPTRPRCTLQVGVHAQRPMQQAGGGRRLLARGGGIDSGGSTWGLVGQGRKPETQPQRPVQPVRTPAAGYFKGSPDTVVHSVRP